MHVYWLEQTEADVPTEENWLHPHEAARLQTVRFPKRRADWLLGRWTAKCALAATLNLHHPAGFEIHAAASGAPEVLIAGEPAPVTISISHRAGRAVCAVAPAGAALGCDLELIEPHSDAFLADYFTPEEQLLVSGTPASDRPRVSTLLWSAKESALKALRQGLRLDTRSVTVSLACAPGRWQALTVRYEDGRIFDGWWQAADPWIRTLAADPRPAAPQCLAGKRGQTHSPPQ